MSITRIVSVFSVLSFHYWLISCGEGGQTSNTRRTSGADAKTHRAYAAGTKDLPNQEFANRPVAFPPVGASQFPNGFSSQNSSKSSSSNGSSILEPVSGNAGQVQSVEETVDESSSASEMPMNEQYRPLPIEGLAWPDISTPTSLGGMPGKNAVPDYCRPTGNQFTDGATVMTGRCPNLQIIGGKVVSIPDYCAPTGNPFVDGPKKMLWECSNLSGF